jgi:hypothetical protein
MDVQEHRHSSTKKRDPYTPPRLEEHGHYPHLTGVSLPLNTSSPDDNPGGQA